MTRDEMKDLMDASLAPLHTTLEHIKTKVCRLEDAYFGNGAPGLKVEVDRLTRRETLRLPIEIAVGCAAAVGFGTYLFWHLFKPT